MPILVIVFWLAFFSLITQQFSNITLESERRDALFSQQPELSFLRTVDDTGQISNLAQLAKNQQKTLIVEFIYTQCRAICLSLGDIFQQAQAAIIEKNLDQKLGLVSISFDVEHESPSTLQAYRKRMHADPKVWSLLTMQNASVLKAASDKIGLIVVPDPQLGFVHNSAFLIVAKTGHLVGIFDTTEIDQAIALGLKTSRTSI